MGPGESQTGSSIWGLVAVAAVLIILSMIFSASESAFLSVNKLRVRFLRNQKNKKAARVWKLLKDRERLINTLLVGNNIVNIAISSIITIISLKLFGSGAVGVATFIATTLLLIFGEISPKIFATRHPEPIAFFFSGFILVLEFVLTPFVFIFTRISNLMLKIFGINLKGEQKTFSEEEIKTFIDMGTEEGLLENNEKKMMHRVFKFTDLEAKDIMIPRKDIVAVSVDDSLEQVLKTARTNRLSRLPVFKNSIDNIVGILYVKDLVKIYGQEDFDSFKLNDVMRPPLFILETKKMSSIQQMLRENHQGMAIVIDEYSGTSGILTTENISQEIFGPLETVYELEAKTSDIKFDQDGKSIIGGQTRLVDLNEILRTKLNSNHCETIGGYISEVLGRIPQNKDFIEAENYIFTVQKMDDKRVAEVKIKAADL